MANKQKHKYSFGFNTRDQIKALAGSAKRRSATLLWYQAKIFHSTFFYI